MIESDFNFARKSFTRGWRSGSSNNVNVMDNIQDSIKMNDLKLNVEILQNKIARLNALIPTESENGDLRKSIKLKNICKIHKIDKGITNTCILCKTQQVNDNLKKEQIRNLRDLRNSTSTSNNNPFNTSNFNQSIGFSNSNLQRSNLDIKLNETKEKISSFIKKHNKSLQISKQENLTTTYISDNIANNVENNFTAFNSSYFGSQKFINKANENFIKKKNNNLQINNSSNITFLHTESVQQFCITPSEKKKIIHNSDNIILFPPRNKFNKEIIFSVSNSRSASLESTSLSKIADNLVMYIEENITYKNNLNNLFNTKESLDESNQLIENLKTNKYTTYYDRYKDDSRLANPNLSHRNSEFSEFFFLNSKQSSRKRLVSNEGINQIRQSILLTFDVEEPISNRHKKKNSINLFEIKPDISILEDFNKLENNSLVYENLDEIATKNIENKQEEFKFDLNKNKIDIDDGCLNQGEENENNSVINKESDKELNYFLNNLKIYEEREIEDEERKSDDINEDSNIINKNDDEKITEEEKDISIEKNIMKEYEYDENLNDSEENPNSNDYHNINDNKQDTNNSDERENDDGEKIEYENNLVEDSSEEDELKEEEEQNLDIEDEDDVNLSEEAFESELYNVEEIEENDNELEKKYASNSNNVDNSSNSIEGNFCPIDPSVEPNKKKVKFSEDKKIISYEEKKNIQNLFIINNDGKVVKNKKRDFNLYLKNLKNNKPKSILITEKAKVENHNLNQTKISDNELALMMLNNLISECDNENNEQSEEDGKQIKEVKEQHLYLASSSSFAKSTNISNFFKLFNSDKK